MQQEEGGAGHEKLQQYSEPEAVPEPEPETKTRCSPLQKSIGLLLFGVLCFVVIDALTSNRIGEGLEDFNEWLQHAGVAGGVAFAFMYAFCTVFFIPGAVLTLGAGYSFGRAYGTGRGLLFGSVVVFVGACMGSMVSFMLARYLLEERVSRWAKKYRILSAIKLAFEKNSLKTVLLLRLSPAIPFVALNYILGITNMKLITNMIGFLGVLPGTVAYVYFGTLIHSASDIGNGEQGDPTVKWVLIIVGSLATIVAIAIVSCMAKRELKASLELQQRQTIQTGVGNTNKGSGLQVKTSRVAVGDGDVERVPDTHATILLTAEASPVPGAAP